MFETNKVPLLQIPAHLKVFARKNEKNPINFSFLSNTKLSSILNKVKSYFKADNLNTAVFDQNRKLIKDHETPLSENIFLFFYEKKKDCSTILIESRSDNLTSIPIIMLIEESMSNHKIIEKYLDSITFMLEKRNQIDSKNLKLVRDTKNKFHILWKDNYKHIVDNIKVENQFLKSKFNSLYNTYISSIPRLPKNWYQLLSNN